MSYYSTYRPQTVAELDQDTARDALGKILTSGTFSHAYLMAGPKGTGKTSSARILAKVLNCKENQGKQGKSLSEPCGECESCKAIVNGTSMAVMEMDAASNRGIDDIRELKERVMMAPVGGSFAVYVVDEVHMLTTEAFNALLKTLEEPPNHAVFVLCTTEIQKLPDTVVSRCTKISFAKASTKEVVRSLKKAVKGEGLEVEAGVLEAIAERVDGSFRDGMKLLEQLAQGVKKITKESLDQATGFSDEYDPQTFIEALVVKDARATLADLARREQQGVEFSLFAKRVVEGLRTRLIAQMMEKGSGNNDLIKLTSLFLDAAAKIKGSVIPVLPLEIAAAEWCLDKPQSGQVNRQPSIAPPKTSPANKSQVSQAPALTQKTPTAVTEKPLKTVETKVEEVSTPVAVAVEEGDIPFETISQQWVKFLQAVRPHNHSLEALLKAAQPSRCVGKSLVIEVYYTFHKEQLEQERHRTILENTFKEVVGVPVRMEFVLGKKEPKMAKKTKAEIANVTGKLDDEALASAAEEIFS